MADFDSILLSYTFAVALYAWSAIQESWGAWILPSVAVSPLLPVLGEEDTFTPMLRHFVDTLHQVMLDCPGKL